MKAKNVYKNLGCEVSIKVPLKEVTNFGGSSLCLHERENLKKTPLILINGLSSRGDVCLFSDEGHYTYVHHKFIKLVK